MKTPSSDEWLLALLEEKSPSEFTAAELEAIRDRTSAAPDVRRAVAEQIRLEEALYAALGDPQVDAKSIRRSLKSQRLRKRMFVVSMLALVCLLALGGVWWAWQRPATLPERTQAASTEKAPDPHRASGTAHTNSPSPRAPVEAPRPTIDLDRPDAAIAGGASDEATNGSAPWEATLSDEAAVVSFLKSASMTFGETVPGFEVADEFPAAEFRRWVSAVPDQPFNVTEGQWRGKRFAGLEGIARLKPNWRNDAVLRIAPFDLNQFALHLWNGQQGITIRFYPHQRPQLLAAYAVARQNDEPRPISYRLVATDNAQFSRSNAGAFEVRHQNGSVVVSRGAVTLLVIPQDHAPEEVLLEGKFRLRTLAMYRGEPVSLDVPPVRQVVTGDTSVGQMAWKTSSDPKSTFDRSPERVTLTTSGTRPDGPRQVSSAFVLLPASDEWGISEAVFRLDNIDVGTGLYFGDAEGRPVHTVFATRNDAAGAPMLSYGWSNRDGKIPDPRWEWNVDPNQELLPAAGKGTWVKLVLGRGGLKIFFSGDGIHWGMAARQPERKSRGPYASVGIFAMADDQRRSISLGRLEIRRLSSIAAMADESLRQRVPDWDRDGLVRDADWLNWVMATQPEDVATEDWLTACAVETLGRGASDQVSRRVISGLATEAVNSDRPVAGRLAILRDLALLSDQWDDGSERFSTWYESLAHRLATWSTRPEELARDSFGVAQAYLTAPAWSERYPEAFPPAAVRNLAAAETWQSQVRGDGSDRNATSSYSAIIAAEIIPSHPQNGWSNEEEASLARVSAWAGASPEAVAAGSGNSIRQAWQHPLVTEPIREAQTLAAELKSALDADAYQDAARLLATIAEVDEFVPALDDSNRFVPPVGLIAEVATRYPGLIEALDEEFGATGLLHVRQSIATSDFDAVRAATVRYYGTPAAAAAHQWLGDCDLAAGRFGEAESHYAAALESAVDEHQQTLEASRQLAAALAGENVESSAQLSDLTITLGSRDVSRSEFDRLIEELHQARSVIGRASVDRNATIPELVPVALEPRGRLEGDVGRNPGRNEFRSGDWAGRQIGVVIADNRAYFTNRFQMAAFDLERKTPAWSVGLGNEQGEAHALPDTAFQPVVRDDRIYVRRLLQRGPELACFDDDENGKLLWRSESNLVFASDPVFVNGRLIAVTVTSTARSGGPFTLSLTRIRTDDGTAQFSVPLVVLNEADDRKPSAQLAKSEDGFVIAAAGTILRCDANGTLNWVRRLPYVAASTESDAHRSPPAAPILRNGNVLLAPPGGQAVICLDVESGQVNWVRPLGELEKIIAVSGRNAIVRLEGGIAGLDIASGATRWFRKCDHLCEGALCDEETLLLSGCTPVEDRRDGLSLLRIDAQSGRLLAEQIVRIDRKEEVRCGPLFVHQERVWAFVGDGWRDPTRTLVEFSPVPGMPAVEPAAEAGPLAHWLALVDSQTRLNTATVLPGWTATARQPGRGAVLLDEFHGERRVMRTHSDREHTAQFVRRVTIAPGQKLTARVGREDEAGWTLRLSVDGEVFASEPINAQTAPEHWRNVVFDLSPLAGRTVFLTLDQGPAFDESNRKAIAVWQRVSIE